MSRLDDYTWADASRDPSLEALSLTVVEPADEGHLALLSPRERSPHDLTVSEALDATLAVEDFAWGSVLVQTDTLDGWTVFLEPNGWATSDADVLARLSAKGRAMNVFWNVNAVMSLGVASGGVLLRQFDPLLYDVDDDRLPEEDDLPFGEPGRVRAASLALLSQLTGLRIDPAWILERRRPTYIVPLAAAGS
jgi:hypothetical protein